MEHMDTAARLTSWALDVPFSRPFNFVFLLAAISFIVSALVQRPFRRHLFKLHHSLVLTQCLFFPAAIAVGVFWANPLADPAIAHHGTPLIYAVALGSLASCVFWIWRMKGFRWFAVSLMTIAEIITWGAIFIAGMSVTGDWL